MPVIVAVVVRGVIVPVVVRVLVLVAVVVRGRRGRALPGRAARSQRRRRSRIANAPMPTTITPEARLSQG